MGTLNTERKNYTIGRGDLFFAERKADGTLGGERIIGNTPAFNLTVSSDSVQHFSSARGMKVQDRDVPVQTTYGASFETDDVNPKNLAALFLGTAAVGAVTSASAVVESFAGIETGLFYQVGISTAHPTGLRKITTVIVKKGVTTAVLNTDYTLDTDLARVVPIQGGLFADGDTMAVTYDRTAYNQDNVASGAVVKEGALHFIAYNPEGDNIDYYLPDVKLSPNGDYVIKSDNDWQKMQFKVSVNTPVNGSAIYADGRAI